MQSEAQTSGVKTTAARAFVRSLNILLKFARLYGFEHARTAEQFQTAWAELRAAMPEVGDSGLLLGVSSNQLLLDGVPLDSAPAERSFAQLLSAAGLSSIHFSSKIVQDDLSKFVRAFPTGSAKPSVLAEQLKVALADNSNLRVNELRFVAEDAELADVRMAANLTARTLGADAAQVKEWLNDPQKLLQLIAAAQGVNSESGRDTSNGPGAQAGAASPVASIEGHQTTAKPVSSGPPGEVEILGIFRLLGQMGQNGPPGSEMVPAQIQNQITQLPEHSQGMLQRALVALAAQAPSPATDHHMLVKLAEHLAVKFALEQYQRGDVRVSAVRQMLDRMNQEISCLRKVLGSHEKRIARAGILVESHFELLDRQFWAQVLDSGKRAILTSAEAWCIPARNIRSYVGELLGRGETELVQGVLRHYASCVASKESEARRTVAAGLSELAEVYGADDGTSLEFAIAKLGSQLCLERENELHTLQAAALARLCQEAVTRRNYPAMLRALDCAVSLEAQRPTTGQDLWPRLGVESRLAELLDDALRQKAIPEGLPSVMAKMPSIAADQLMTLFNRCTYREDCNLLTQIAAALDKPCLTYLRDLLRGNRPLEAVEALGLLSRLQPEAISEFLPSRLREAAPALQDRAVRLLACGGAPERGNLLLDLLPFFHVLVRPLALEEIGLSGTTHAILKLIPTAEEENSAVCAPYARLKAIEALGRLRGTPAAPVLHHILESKQLWRWTYPAELRIASFQAMQKIDPEWARDFLARSGLDEGDLSFTPLDPVPDSPWYRQRRYPRLRLTQPVPAVTINLKETCHLDIKLLSLSGGMATFDRHIGSGTVMELRIGSSMRTLHVHAIVRTARTQGLAFEILDITLEDRSRLRKLLTGQSMREPGASGVDSLRSGRIPRATK